MALEHQFTIFESATRNFRFPPFKNDDAIFEFTVKKGFSIQFDLLFRKFGFVRKVRDSGVLRSYP